MDHGQELYSSDLRDRVVAFVEAGHSRRSAARLFGVSDSFAVKLLRRVAQFGSGGPVRQGRPPGERLLASRRSSSGRWRPSLASPCRS
ncbi:IS630 transposase-related protein [Mesorhizobium sp. CCNWLW176]|uniref:IS630 transposase-related protein n=1 Tax=unclassified Mesorhizobium TaxID=325217 RepID=UPI003FA5840E